MGNLLSRLLLKTIYMFVKILKPKVGEKYLKLLFVLGTLPLNKQLSLADSTPAGAFFAEKGRVYLNTGGLLI